MGVARSDGGPLSASGGWPAALRGYRLGMGEKLGRAKEVVGWATGDREVEAEGRVEQRSDDEISDEDVKQTEREVRADHQEVVPDEES